MRHNVEFRNWSPDSEFRKLIDDSIASLDRLAAGIREDALFLRLSVEMNSARTLYRVSLTLDVPGPNLATQAERHDGREALHDAFAEIERQLIKHKEKLSHSHQYKGSTRRAQLMRLKVGMA